MKIVSDAVIGLNTEIEGARQPGAFTALQLQSDWWILLELTPTAREIPTKTFSVWTGDNNVQAVYMTITLSTTLGAANQVNVEMDLTGDTSANTLVTLPNLTSDSEFVMQYKASDQLLHLIVNDVEVGTAGPYDLSTLTTGGISILADMTATAASSQLHRITAATGLYV